MFTSSLTRPVHFNRCSGEASSELQLVHIGKVLYHLSKARHLMCTCKSTIGGLGNSISYGSKDTTWSLPIISRYIRDVFLGQTIGNFIAIEFNHGKRKSGTASEDQRSGIFEGRSLNRPPYLQILAKHNGIAFTLLPGECIFFPNAAGNRP
ncbi:hypothetical protein CDAR_373801 [Caerostris darwini]|uniref:Ribosomal protein L2 n=1 Tax=Caerostris darwini TaxID=1538125 RepID=A0AAV4QFW9_9ARAC|nr:hypothetical protein CDAR_373801 [Caerostris darwini]